MLKQLIATSILALSASVHVAPLSAQSTAELMTDSRTPPKPIGNPEAWVKRSDFPAEAKAQGVQGVVGYRLKLDAEGQPYSCKIMEKSGSELLDQKTCEVLGKRARFKPATTGGMQIQSTYSDYMKWEFPGELRGRNAMFKGMYQILDNSGQLWVNDCTRAGFGRIPEIETRPFCGKSGEEYWLKNLIRNGWQDYRLATLQMIRHTPDDVGPDKDLHRRAKRSLNLDFLQRDRLMHLEFTVTPQGKVTECKRKLGRLTLDAAMNACSSYVNTKVPIFEPIPTKHGNQKVIQVYELVYRDLAWKNQR